MKVAALRKVQRFSPPSKENGRLFGLKSRPYFLFFLSVLKAAEALGFHSFQVY